MGVRIPGPAPGQPSLSASALYPWPVGPCSPASPLALSSCPTWSDLGLTPGAVHLATPQHAHRGVGMTASEKHDLWTLGRHLHRGSGGSAGKGRSQGSTCSGSHSSVDAFLGEGDSCGPPSSPGTLPYSPPLPAARSPPGRQPRPWL